MMLFIMSTDLIMQFDDTVATVFDEEEDVEDNSGDCFCRRCSGYCFVEDTVATVLCRRCSGYCLCRSYSGYCSVEDDV